MCSVASLVSTAASEESSSADSPYYCSSNGRKPLRPRSYNLKVHGSVIGKGAVRESAAAKQKVFCVCTTCNGERMVSRSTCYRHLRLEAEIAEDNAKWEARWVYSALASVQNVVRLQNFEHAIWQQLKRPSSIYHNSTLTARPLQL